MKKATQENMRVLETLQGGLELPEKVAPHEDKQPPKKMPQKGFVLVSDLSLGGDYLTDLDHDSPDPELSFWSQGENNLLIN